MSSSNPNISVKINGEITTVPQNISILSLLETYKINKERVVIELNKEILNKEIFGNTYLKNNDLLEVVTFVGGG